MNVLVIENEERVSDFIRRGLKAEGHGVTVAPSGTAGCELGTAADFDAIILDLLLPDIHGFKVCQRLRHAGVLTPVLILSAMDTTADRVQGLRAGADDYLTKPFDFEELLARLEALVRRTRNFSETATCLRAGGLSFDREKLEVRSAAGPVDLTARELALLELLMSAPGKVFSRTRILNTVWGYSEDPLTNVVDVYIARLRKKLGQEGLKGPIETVRGHGYRLRPD